MARIKIADLPLLQDLTEEQLKELFGAGAKSYKPTFEALEDRQLMSGFSSLLGTQMTAVSAYSAFTSPQSTIDFNVKPPIQVISQEPVALVASYEGSTTQVIPSNNPVLQTQIDPSAVFQQGTNFQQPSGLTQPILAAIDQPSQTVLEHNPQQVAIDAILRKEQELGAYLGKRVGDPIALDYGYSRVQQYENGKYILFSPATGEVPPVNGVPQPARAYEMEGLIGEEFARAGGITKLGYPTSDGNYMSGRSDTWAQVFTKKIQDPLTLQTVDSKSLIVWTQQDGAHMTTGAILSKYLALGGGAYGTPYGSIHKIYHDTYAQDFRYGGPDGPLTTIVTGLRTGVHDVVGSIRQAWLNWGGPAFGNPVTDSTAYHASGDTQNDIVQFKDADGNGKAIASTSSGPVFVVGNIYDAWISLKGPSGFGKPISSEGSTLAYGDRTAKFNTFVTLDGTVKAIYWIENPPSYLTGTAPHFLVDRGDGQGLAMLDGFTHIPGPTGLEPIDGPTGTTSAPLTVGSSSLDLSTIYQQSTVVSGSPALKAGSSGLDLSTIYSGTPSATWLSPGAATVRNVLFSDTLNLGIFDSIYMTPVSQPLPDFTPGPGPDLPPAPASVTDTSTITFALAEDDGTAHQLQITARTTLPDGSATFQGVWDGQNGAGQQVAGTLAYDDAGNAHMTFSGDNETFDGTISGNHLDGKVTMLGADPAQPVQPVHVAGDQALVQTNEVTDFSNVTFALSDVNGTAHQLQITDQAGQPDGTATFNGVWDGQNVTGTLAYDAAGNVHMTFSADNGTYDTMIAGNLGAFQIAGNFTVGDTLVPVTGSQIA